ncbi:MAG: F420-nonreducing hydrogenase [Deltaproteobacteria bacterium]|nr:MAG: F420-nonreducing hydrogenase [Deltaproteobacteria bacterium]
MNRSDMITEILDDFGYGHERFKIAWVSSAEPDKFVAAVTEMTQTIKKLGPLHGQNAEAA